MQDFLLHLFLMIYYRKKVYVILFENMNVQKVLFNNYNKQQQHLHVLYKYLLNVLSWKNLKQLLNGFQSTIKLWELNR